MIVLRQNNFSEKVLVNGKLKEDLVAKAIWDYEKSEWEYSALKDLSYKDTDFQKFKNNLVIKKEEDWEDSYTAELKSAPSWFGYWDIELDKSGEILDISYND